MRVQYMVHFEYELDGGGQLVRAGAGAGAGGASGVEGRQQRQRRNEVRLQCKVHYALEVECHLARAGGARGVQGRGRQQRRRTCGCSLWYIMNLMEAGIWRVRLGVMGRVGWRGVSRGS